MKYAIWNNKGGVGKSFLTFVLATEYAKKNPNKQVCIIDMCPQANVSEIVLGGNGRGYENLSKLLANEHDENKNKNRKTIGGYFDKRLSNPDKNTGSESEYVIEVRKDLGVTELPDNLLLVSGDPSLELQVQSINQIASVDLPEDRWANVHKWIIDLQEGISSKYTNNVTYFIDCNPSFATYTAQAVIASKRLIVPCTADGASARAIDTIGKLLFGVDVSQLYSKTNFSVKAKASGLEVPTIHLVLLNRYTTSSNAPSKAFEAMYEEIRIRINTLKDKMKLQADIVSLEVPDAHAVAITASELATPISDLKNSLYILQHGKTQIQRAPLESYQKAISNVIDLL